MATPTDQATNQPATDGGTHPLLQRIAADAQAQGGAAAKPAEPSGATQDSPDSVEIEIGGTKRLVSKKDLQETYASKLSLDQREQALKQQLQQAGTDEQLRAFRDAMMKLPPQRQAQVLELIQGKDPQKKATNGRPSGNPSADDLMRAALVDDDSDDEVGATHTIDPHDYQQLRSVVEMLSQSYIDTQVQRQQESAGERVDKLIAQFPVLRNDRIASSFAKDHILTKFLQANGRMDLDQAVQEAATRAQQLKDSAQSEQVQQVTNGVPRLALPNGFKPDAHALQSGILKQAALARIRQLQG